MNIMRPNPDRPISQYTARSVYYTYSYLHLRSFHFRWSGHICTKHKHTLDVRFNRNLDTGMRRAMSRTKSEIFLRIFGYFIHIRMDLMNVIYNDARWAHMPCESAFIFSVWMEVSWLHDYLILICMRFLVNKKNPRRRSRRELCKQWIWSDTLYHDGFYWTDTAHDEVMRTIMGLR